MKDALLGLFVAGLTGLLLLGSCGLTGNGEEEKAKVDSTYFRATLNGEENWSGEARSTFYSQYGYEMLGISVDTIHRKNYPYTETLTFDVKFKNNRRFLLTRTVQEVGNYSVRTGASYFESDGDVLIAKYSPTEDSSANYLTIAKYDSATSIMEGTFRTTLVVDSADREAEPGESSRRRPDTLRFTDGEFRVKVEDRRDE